MTKSNRDRFNDVYSGAQDPPLLPPVRGDPQPDPPLPDSLQKFRILEGKQQRESRLRLLWSAIVEEATADADANTAQKPQGTATADAAANPTEEERARKLKDLYRNELYRRCSTTDPTKPSSSKPVEWSEFIKYADEKEEELFRVFHDELDLDGNGRLDATELRAALAKAGMLASHS